MGKIIVWVNERNFDLFMANQCFKAYAKPKEDSCVQIDIPKNGINHYEAEEDNILFTVRSGNDW